MKIRGRTTCRAAAAQGRQSSQQGYGVKCRRKLQVGRKQENHKWWHRKSNRAIKFIFSNGDFEFFWLVWRSECSQSGRITPEELERSRYPCHDLSPDPVSRVIVSITGAWTLVSLCSLLSWSLHFHSCIVQTLCGRAAKQNYWHTVVLRMGNFPRNHTSGSVVMAWLLSVCHAVRVLDFRRTLDGRLRSVHSCAISHAHVDGIMSYMSCMCRYLCWMLCH